MPNSQILDFLVYTKQTIAPCCNLGLEGWPVRLLPQQACGSRGSGGQSVDRISICLQIFCSFFVCALQTGNQLSLNPFSSSPAWMLWPTWWCVTVPLVFYSVVQKDGMQCMHLAQSYFCIHWSANKVAKWKKSLFLFWPSSIAPLPSSILLNLLFCWLMVGKPALWRITTTNWARVWRHIAA